MANKRYIALTLTLLIAWNIQAQGRAPAVEPVTGLSIDQMPESTPEKDPGFQFGSEPEKLRPSLAPLRQDNKKTQMSPLPQSRVQQSLESSDHPWSLYSIMIGMFLLPLALWIGILKQKKHHEVEEDNLLPFEAAHSRHDHDDDDPGLPKAG